MGLNVSPGSSQVCHVLGVVVVFGHKMSFTHPN